MLYPDLVQRLSIGPCHIRHANLIWIKHLLEELKFDVKLPMTMYCDNQTTIHIASNPVFNERSKHIEVDCHLV